MGWSSGKLSEQVLESGPNLANAGGIAATDGYRAGNGDLRIYFFHCIDKGADALLDQIIGGKRATDDILGPDADLVTATDSVGVFVLNAAGASIEETVSSLVQEVADVSAVDSTDVNDVAECCRNDD